MTELSTEPVVAPAPPTAPPPDTPPPSAKAQEDVEHTPGGWPIVPLALSGANSTVGAVAAASLAGGPIAAAVAATGMVVLGTVAATRSRKPHPRREARRAASRAAGISAARSAGLRSSGKATRGSSGGRSAGSRAGRSGGRSGKVPGQHRRSTGPAAGHGSAATSKKAQGKSGHGLSKHAAGKATGRAGQVKAQRAAQKAAAGSRAGQRAQTTSARRAVADARRNAKAAAGTTRLGKRGGLAGRLMGGAVRKARAARDAAIAKQRTKRDAKTGAAIAGQRANIRKAPARAAARKALRKSAARFHGRRLLAALLALPVGALGCLSTWIGRKLNIPALMHPGRRLYRRMVQSASEQRAARDEEARKTLREQEAAADEQAAKDGTEGIADSVERPATVVPTSTIPQVSEGEHVSSSGFKFEDHATEMQAAAMLYEPDGCMEILAMVEGLPEALNMVAHVMQILAERSDSEFPLEKEVANGFNDIYDLLRKAAAGAEELPAIFRRVHEQDIARHEDPRNGTEAEKGWNV
ncbi:hypothetical protein QFZ22_007214 [Streptomyces canus]|uniref:Uncharacterized protein n=1 Tax=Streptomyces canus TaxID=58343 RepID=A0AAW8FN34_9ACTN|nr:hypothetical protein [Streptomyces canus]MDQ0911229.1 hypothetical protein [Streptomyces canus]